jgi:hypothetical protein
MSGQQEKLQSRSSSASADEESRYDQICSRTDERNELQASRTEMYENRTRQYALSAAPPTTWCRKRTEREARSTLVQQQRYVDENIERREFDRNECRDTRERETACYRDLFETISQAAAAAVAAASATSTVAAAAAGTAAAAETAATDTKYAAAAARAAAANCNCYQCQPECDRNRRQVNPIGKTTINRDATAAGAAAVEGAAAAAAASAVGMTSTATKPTADDYDRIELAAAAAVGTVACTRERVPDGEVRLLCRTLKDTFLESLPAIPEPVWIIGRDHPTLQCHICRSLLTSPYVSRCGHAVHDVLCAILKPDCISRLCHVARCYKPLKLSHEQLSNPALHMNVSTCTLIQMQRNDKINTKEWRSAVFINQGILREVIERELDIQDEINSWKVKGMLYWELEQVTECLRNEAYYSEKNLVFDKRKYAALTRKYK